MVADLDARSMYVPWQVRKDVEDLLWKHFEHVRAYRDRYNDLAQSGGCYDDDDAFQRHLLAWSDPTGAHAVLCDADVALRDLRRLILPVARLKLTLKSQDVRLAAVLEYAYLSPRYRTSGAYVIALAARVPRESIKGAKTAIVEHLAQQMGRG